MMPHGPQVPVGRHSKLHRLDFRGDRAKSPAQYEAANTLRRREAQVHLLRGRQARAGVDRPDRSQILPADPLETLRFLAIRPGLHHESLSTRRRAHYWANVRRVLCSAQGSLRRHVLVALPVRWQRRTMQL